MAADSVTRSIEVESKFEVPEGFELPKLTKIAGVTAVTEPVTYQLDAVYYDTIDLRLQHAKITLRRREGGKDAGWHLKLPATDGARVELRAPLSQDIPEEFVHQVLAVTRGAQLEPTLGLKTTRLVRYLHDEHGATLAEVADDHVVAERNWCGQTTTWRELEVELVDGDTTLATAAHKTLTKAGASPSGWASKARRALDGHPGMTSTDAAAQDFPDGSAADVVVSYVREQISAILRYDPLVRSDAPDAVHQMRVSCRRLRSGLQTFRPLFDTAQSEPLREELKWLAGELGPARDTEVILEEVTNLIATQPEWLELTDVEARAQATLQQRYRQAHGQAVAAMLSERYLTLLDTLHQWHLTPPVTPESLNKADQTILPLINKNWRKLKRLHAAAETDEAIHELRKGAKRNRYASEALVSQYGQPAKDWAKLTKQITENLGTVQDSVVIRDTLLELAHAAHEAGEDTFAYGYLYATVEALAQQSVSGHEDHWPKLQDKTARAWFRKA